MWTETFTTTYIKRKRLIYANKKTLDGKLLKGKRKAKVFSSRKIVVVMPVFSFDEMQKEIPELFTRPEVLVKFVSEEDFKLVCKDII